MGSNRQAYEFLRIVCSYDDPNSPIVTSCLRSRTWRVFVVNPKRLHPNPKPYASDPKPKP